jgi:hypothetical protein
MLPNISEVFCFYTYTTQQTWARSMLRLLFFKINAKY